MAKPEVAVPFGKRRDDGLLTVVANTEQGKDCDCVCPECGADLIARHGKNRRWHFAHASNADATRACGETSLHRMAKQVIVGLTGTGKELCLGPDYRLVLRSAEPEKRMDELGAHGRQPDIYAVGDIMNLSGQRLATDELLIEIGVSHFKDDGYIADVNAAGYAAWELSLTRKQWNNWVKESRRMDYLTMLEDYIRDTALKLLNPPEHRRMRIWACGCALPSITERELALADWHQGPVRARSECPDCQKRERQRQEARAKAEREERAARVKAQFDAMIAASNAAAERSRQEREQAEAERKAEAAARARLEAERKAMAEATARLELDYNKRKDELDKARNDRWSEQTRLQQEQAELKSSLERERMAQEIRAGKDIPGEHRREAMGKIAEAHISMNDGNWPYAYVLLLDSSLPLHGQSADVVAERDLAWSRWHSRS